METNPWHVESILAFYFLKCPECNFDTKEEKSFQNHAITNHPLSSVFFGENNLEKKIVILEQKSNKSDSWIQERFAPNLSVASVKEETNEDLDDIPPPPIIDNSFESSEETEEAVKEEPNVTESFDIYSKEIKQENCDENIESITDPLSGEVSSLSGTLHIPNYRENLTKNNLTKTIKSTYDKNKYKKRNKIAEKADILSNLTGVDKSQEQHKCEFCHKTFGYKHARNRHVKTVHFQMRCWQCDYCDSKFKQRSDLNNHVLAKHHKVRPWTCHYCNMSFTQKSNLTKHIRTMHENQQKLDTV